MAANMKWARLIFLFNITATMYAVVNVKQFQNVYEIGYSNPIDFLSTHGCKLLSETFPLWQNDPE